MGFQGMLAQLATAIKFVSHVAMAALFAGEGACREYIEEIEDHEQFGNYTPKT